MVSFHVQKMRWVAIAAAIFCTAASQNLVAQGGACPCVVYTGSGIFTLISGQDVFELNNKPFSLTIKASEAAVPVKSGTMFNQYSNLALNATVTSGLTPNPFTISNKSTSMVLAVASSFDLLQVHTGVKVATLAIGIGAKIHMGLGTFTSDTILPFTHPVTLTANNATLTYSATVNGVVKSTTLGMVGSLNTTVTTATLANAASVAAVILHSGGAESITSHPDGTKSVRPVSGGVEPGAAQDKVALQFYASGVRDASEVHVQIAGQPVRVLYAGPADHFAGLDEVMVELPRSLASYGDADVTLTVDGQTASPVRIHIQ